MDEKKKLGARFTEALDGIDRVLSNHMRRYAEIADVTMLEKQCLYCLAGGVMISPNILANELQIPLHFVEYVTDNLVERGWIEEIEVNGEQKFTLSENGGARLARVMDLNIDINAEILASLEDDEREYFVKMIEKVYRIVSERW